MRTTRSTKNKEKNSTFRSFERPLSSIETKKNRKKPCFLGSASRSARRARPWTAWAAASAGPKCTSKRVRRNLDVEEEKKRRELISAAPAPALPPSRELLPPPSSLSPSDQLAFPLFPTTSTPLQPHRRPLRSRIKIKPPSKTPSISLPPPHLSARRLFDALVGRGRIRRSVGDGGGRRPLGGQVQRVVWGGHQRYVESLVLSGDDESGEREKKKTNKKKKTRAIGRSTLDLDPFFSLSLLRLTPRLPHTHKQNSLQATAPPSSSARTPTSKTAPPSERPRRTSRLLRAQTAPRHRGRRRSAPGSPSATTPRSAPASSSATRRSSAWGPRSGTGRSSRRGRWSRPGPRSPRARSSPRESCGEACPLAGSGRSSRRRLLSCP